MSNPVPLALVSVFFGGEALLGLILGVGVGRRFDRWRSRVPAMRLAATWVVIGWLVFALLPYVWLSLVMGAVFVSAGAITMGQAFAALHDVMVRDAERRPEFVNALIRTAFSLGFVLGPLLGSALAALVSFRAAFVVAGFLNLLCIVLLTRYVTQALDALVVAAVSGLGLTYAQRLSPDRAGLASSTFGSALGVATLVGNLIGDVSLPILGVPHLFFIPPRGILPGAGRVHRSRTHHVTLSRWTTLLHRGPPQAAARRREQITCSSSPLKARRIQGAVMVITHGNLTDW